MQNPVVIKGNKAGMTVYLDPALPFTELLEAVKKKFRETARFWGSAQMTLTLEGRRLSPEEEFSVVNAITENSGIEILCLIDADAERIRRCEKALNEKLMELSASTGQFYKGNLRNGDVLESDIIILGTLKGTAQAGLSGNRNAVVVAMEMAPSQVRISDLAFQKAEKGRLLGWGPMMILIKNGRICSEPIKKSFLSALNFI